MAKKAQKVSKKKAPAKTQRVPLKKAVKNEPRKKNKVKKEINVPTMITLPLVELTNLLVAATLAGRDGASIVAHAIQTAGVPTPAEVANEVTNNEVQTRGEEVTESDF